MKALKDGDLAWEAGLGMVGGEFSFVVSTQASLICHVCSEPHRPEARFGDSLRVCVKCSHPLVRPVRPAGEALAWAITALVAFGLLAFLPLIEVDKLGIGREVLITGVGAGVRNQGDVLLGFFVDFCVIYAPLALLISIIVLQAAAALGRPFPGWRLFLEMHGVAFRWAMPDVLLLAILVSFLKIEAMARAGFEYGSLALAAGVVALALATQAFSADWVRSRLEPSAGDEEKGRRRLRAGSTQAALALLLAAAIMLVPANVLPIMEVNQLGDATRSTIFGGIAQLAGHGLWGIALMVFVASFLVPIGKLAGLGWLLFRARHATGGADCVRLHRWLDFIGRWSMLDVLLIGVLCGLVQFGGLAEVRPGPGAPAFAAVVVLTVLAVEAFPLPRLFRRQ